MCVARKTGEYPRGRPVVASKTDDPGEFPLDTLNRVARNRNENELDTARCSTAEIGFDSETGSDIVRYSSEEFTGGHAARNSSTRRPDERQTVNGEGLQTTRLEMNAAERNGRRSFTPSNSGHRLHGPLRVYSEIIVRGVPTGRGKPFENVSRRKTRFDVIR